MNIGEKPLLLSLPENARKEYVSLWHVVLTKRTEQLKSLNEESLQSLLNSNRSNVLSQKKEELMEWIRIGLTNYFHTSINTTLGSDTRLNALQDLKSHLQNIDRAHSTHHLLHLQQQQQQPPPPQQAPQPQTNENDSSTPHHYNHTTASNVNDSVVTASKFAQSAFSVAPTLPTHAPAAAATTTTTAAPSNSTASSTSATAMTVATVTSQGYPPQIPPTNADREKQSGGYGTSTATQPSRPAEPEIIEIELDDTDDEDEPPPPAAAEEEEEEQEPAMAPSTSTIVKRKVREEGTYVKRSRNVSMVCGPELIPCAALQPRTTTLRLLLEVQDGDKSTQLNGAQLDDFYQRLQQWDPYWNIVHDVSTHFHQQQYEMGYQTAPIQNPSPANTEVKMAVQIPIAIDVDPKTGIMCPPDQSFFSPHGKLRNKGPNGQTIAWGQPITNRNQHYQDGTRRLILRTLPLHRSDYDAKKRADTHIWPKGTYLQIHSHTPLPLIQRKQQSHDDRLWKGQCQICDLTPYASPQRSLLELCTRDTQPYMVQLAICDYVDPQNLYNQCTTPNTPHTLTTLSHQQGLDMALTYVNRPAVVLDDTSDDDSTTNNNNNNNNSTNHTDNNNITIRMLCPVSMTPIVTPVRGKHCQHMQCFDLKNFLQTNATVSGGRWRCAVCENFVSLQDCIIDGFQKHILQTYQGQISSIRDKVQIFSNGTHTLMEENRLRYNKPNSNHTESSNAQDNQHNHDNNDDEPPSKRVKSDAPTEVIELQ